MSVPTSSGTPFAMSARILAGSLMGALLFIGVALFYVLPTDGAPPLWVFLAQVVAGIAIHFFLEAIGYRVQALDPSMSDDDAAAAARVRWQSSMILRFALCEVVALASIAAAFVLEEGGFLVYAVGALVSLRADDRARVAVVAPRGQDGRGARVRRPAVPPARGLRPVRPGTDPAPLSGAAQTMSGACTRASSASWSVGMSWLCFSASTRRR